MLGHDRRTNDIAVVSCRTLERLSYRAGQYVTLETPYRPPLWRTYSIADAG